MREINQGFVALVEKIGSSQDEIGISSIINSLKHVYEKLRVRCRKQERELYQELGFLTEMQDNDKVWMAYMLTSKQ